MSIKQGSEMRRCSGRLAAGLFIVAIATCALAQQTDGPTMKDVNDVLGGQATILQQDDAGLLITTQPVVGNFNLYAQLTPLDSTNSVLTPQTPVSLGNSNLFSFYTPNSVVTSSASGRMFNNSNDVVISITTAVNKNNLNPAWYYNYWNPATGSNQQYLLNSQLLPNAPQVASRVIWGDFQGDYLSCPLLFVESVFKSYTLWGMNIVTAPNVDKVDVIDPYGGGPQYSREGTKSSQIPIIGSIVAGDFNNDGVDEIAALMSDGKTIQLYKVNPATMQITPYSSFTLPALLGPATLAAGRFGSSPNVVLAAVGQQSGSDTITVYYIDPRVTPVTPVATTLPPTNSYYDNIPINGVLAKSAPIINWSSNSSEQLVIGLQYIPPHAWSSGFVWIGTFDGSSGTNAGTFYLQGATDALRESGCLLNMQVGNFNNLSGNQVNPDLQVAIFENIGSGGALCTPNFDGGYLWIVIANITVPAAIQADPQSAPPGGPTDWLSQASSIEPDIGPYDKLQNVSLVTGDFQGRSLRLGAPEKITLSTQIQPDLVLGMPPMHVDWINPYFLGKNNCEPNSQGKGVPQCILNLTVKPYANNANQTSAFSSSYRFSNNSVVSSTRKASTSWGLSAKVSVGVSVKYKIPELASEKLSIVSTTSDAYNNVKSSYQSSYSGYSEALTAQTGFDDLVFFTSANQNIFNYPVLGELDANGNQVYMSFSVPSSVQRSELNGSTQEWYQPIHEAGNVLSYPWTPGLVAQEFPSGQINQLATSNCLSVGSVSDTTTVSWTNGSSSGSSAGWSDSLSSNLDTTSTTKIGGGRFIAGTSVKITVGLDIGGSASWSSVNEASTTLTTGQAIELTVPQFDKTFTSEFGYAFQNVVFGVTNPNPPNSQNGIGSDGTFQGSLVPANTTDIPPATGPLYIGYLANPVNNGPGISCGQSGTNWWNDAYNLPDVGFNHPNRWDVTGTDIVSFNDFEKPSVDAPIIDQPFYQMKGLWVTGPSQPDDPANVGMTIQSATAGEQLTLTARVYDFSLVPTNQTDSNSTVHVRFYGQKVCPNVQYGSGTITDVCPDGAFVIPAAGRDGDFVISSIPGVNQSGSPNWTLASVHFDTTGYDNANLVFWAVTWIEDGNGNIIAEMPDHGVKPGSFAGKAFTNITDVPLQQHSNNVGMFATSSWFHILPASSADAASAPTTFGPLKSISLSLGSRKLLLDHKARVGVTFNSGDSFDGSPVAYYDGNPGRGGKLFDYQTIHDLAPDSSDGARVFFRPESCGWHTVYAVSNAEGFPPTIGKVSAYVTVEPVEVISEMINYLRGLALEPSVEDPLQDKLEHARHHFREGQVHRGLESLEAFDRLIPNIPQTSGTHLKEQLQSLLGQSQTIISCAPTLRDRDDERASR